MTIRSFVALGDSFTEGLDDVLRADGRHTGWADRVANALLVEQGLPSLEYANLAIRGRLLGHVIDEQVPVAVAWQPDLVTLGAGVNDALRRSFDLDAVATDLENGVRALREGGSEVLLFVFGDPGRRSRVFGRIKERLRDMRTAYLAIAAEYGCSVVDFWGVATYDDDRLWAPDRLHLSALGHEITSRAVLESLGFEVPAWRTPLPNPPRDSWSRRRRSDAQWIAGHAGPWLARRARGVSSGAGITPKDPKLRTIHR